MKTKSIFACLMFSFSIALYAQSSNLEYWLFAQDNKIWSTQVGLIQENLYESLIDGDTLIGGETWKKVNNDIWPLLHPSSNYYAAIRDVGKKVYAIVKGSNRPRLLYDFGLKVGDFVKCGVEGNAFCCLLDKGEEPDSLLGFPFESYLRLERIDTIMVRGLLLRRFTLTLCDAYQFPYIDDPIRGKKEVTENVVWVEGIGSGAGPFSPWIPLPPKGMIYHACLLNRTFIFGNDDFYESHDATTISSTRSTTNVCNTTFDLFGRPVTNLQSPGVYIRDGHKQMLR